MNRIYEGLKELVNDRFAFIVGDGISDLFLSDSNKFESFLPVFNSVLQLSGFDRIIHLSPTQPIRCIDDKSIKLSEHVLWSKRESTLESGIILELRQGPLGGLENNRVKENYPKNSGLGDIHGLRMLDAIFCEVESFNTACVIYDALTLATHFEAPRLLWGILNQWSLLPAYNKNVCFFVINVQDESRLLEMLGNLPLRQFLKESAIPPTFPNLVKIKYPNQNELLLLIKNYYHLGRVAEEEIQKIARICYQENISIRTWLSRFDSLDYLSLESLRKNGWTRHSIQDSRSIEEKLSNFIGLDNVKQFIRLINGYAQFIKERNTNQNNRSFHMVFYGNPGTGKTSIARIFGQIFHESGILQKGQLIEVKGSDLISDHVGGTGKYVNTIIDQALDGILFIDEAYSLSAEDRGGFGKEAIEVLIKRMEDDRSRFVVIIAGYKDEMVQFIKSNPGLDRRFPISNRLEFPDLEPDELLHILKNDLCMKGVHWDKEIEPLLQKVVYDLFRYRNRNFGNAGEIRNLSESIDLRIKARIAFDLNATHNLLLNDIPNEYLSTTSQESHSIEEILSPLDGLVGLTEIKEHIISIVKILKVDELLSKDSLVDNRQYLENYLFIGNPGTGKTTTAKVIGKIFKDLGFLKSSSVVDVSAVDLIAGYVGQTPKKTLQVIDRAIGGVLFIDEAYTLDTSGEGKSQNFGNEVVDTLVKYLDEYKGRLIVIMAGYEEEMVRLLSSNPGLRSRFNKVIKFPDFQPSQLGDILFTLCETKGYILTDDIKESAINLLLQGKSLSPTTFGNAREVKRIFDHMARRLANRVVQNPDKYLDPIELPESWNTFELKDLDGFDLILDEHTQSNLTYLRRPSYSPQK
jgi:AAA+ superfamily predicted ATPase